MSDRRPGHEAGGAPAAPSCQYRATCDGSAPAVLRVIVRRHPDEVAVARLDCCDSCAAELLAPWQRWQRRPFAAAPAPSLDTRQQVRRQCDAEGAR